ncbi:peroxidasin-like isoform X2 [Rhopilema esculentum]|uniref:peroxidasin-like isoform X2 n=1 Tax=Rhopilema esculentum TaxID=499914 RepID=UPI0031DC5FF3
MLCLKGRQKVGVQKTSRSRGHRLEGLRNNRNLREGFGLKKRIMGFGKLASATTGRRPDFVSCFNSRITKHIGEDLELNCIISGSPFPQVTWSHNDRLLDTNNPRFSFSQGSRKLMIKTLNLDDAGYYTCTAKNQLAEVSRTCTLAVRANPRSNAPKVLKQPREVRVQEGQGAELSCVVHNPKGIFSAFLWSKNGHDVDETSVRLYKREKTEEDGIKAILEFLNVQKTDQGRYQLRFVNMFGDVTTDEVALCVV